MAVFVFMFAAMCLGVIAAPPAPPSPHLYQQQRPAQLQQINPLNYYREHPELHGYYYQQQQQQQKQDEVASNSNQPSRLETLEPDSEVELVPGAQQPQQPPQHQPPVAPNLPGLLPGQRVFIVHMPVPGYRPGTIGGYQPLYIVAAAPQGNLGFPGSGYYNADGTILLNPSNQVVAPLGYPQGVVQRGGPVLIQSANPLAAGAPRPLNGPYDLNYEYPIVKYHGIGPIATQPQEDLMNIIRLMKLLKIQNKLPDSPHSVRPQATRSETEALSAEPKQLSEDNDSKEERNVRPTSAHAQSRAKL